MAEGQPGLFTLNSTYIPHKLPLHKRNTVNISQKPPEAITELTSAEFPSFGFRPCILNFFFRRLLPTSGTDLVLSFTMGRCAVTVGFFSIARIRGWTVLSRVTEPHEVTELRNATSDA